MLSDPNLRLLQLVQNRKDKPTRFCQALRTQFVEGVFKRVVIGIPGTIIEVDDIDTGDSDIQKWQMIVLNRGLI